MTEKAADDSSALDHGGAVDLTIIVVSFNTRAMTLACLNSIIAQTKDDLRYEIIVVDNNSRDGSVDAISGQFSSVRLIALQENIGFAGANNLAARAARGRRLLLLNPDTVVLDRAIERLFAFAEQSPLCQIWGGRTLFGDKSLNPTSCWRRISFWTLLCSALGLSYLAPNSRVLNPEAYGGWPRDTVRHVDIVTGCFLLIDKELWERLEGFDPAFFMYGDEADLCYRAVQAGARPIFTPGATIVHYGSPSVYNGTASDRDALDKRVKAARAAMLLIERQFSPLARPLARGLSLFGPLNRWWAYRLTARLFRRPDLDKKADYWQALWRRRAEWAQPAGRL